MRFRQLHIILLLLWVMLLTACSQVEPLQNERLTQAAEFNQQAMHAFQRGRYSLAATLYERALQLDVAIEHVDGIAIDTLNLARVSQVRGDYAQAHAYLDVLLTDGALDYGRNHLAVAAMQKSLLYLQAGKVEEAGLWVDKAAAWCVASCTLAGVIGNVRAGIALRAGDADKGLYWAERAASVNRNASQSEYSNSLRWMATARMMQGKYDIALRLCGEALVIDKTQGLPEKIRQDLLLSAQVYGLKGAGEQAARYRERALRIQSAENR